MFLLEPWWNPAVEEQAIDRVHRIGQTKQVNVVRFLCEGSIEERMYEINQTKKNLFDYTIIKSKEELQKEKFENLKLIFSRP